MLTLHPHQRTEAAKQVIRSWQKIQSGWPIFLVVWACTFQVFIAFTLAAAPWHQLLTVGTRPVFSLADRYVWALLYLLSGVVTGSALWIRPVWVQVLSWVAVMGLGGVWLTAFAVNVLNGGGSALGVVAWAFLYVPVVAVAVHQIRTSR